MYMYALSTGLQYVHNHLQNFQMVWIGFDKTILNNDFNNIDRNKVTFVNLWQTEREKHRKGTIVSWTWTNFKEIWIEIETFSLNKIH